MLTLVNDKLNADNVSFLSLDYTHPILKVEVIGTTCEKDNCKTSKLYLCSLKWEGQAFE